MRPSYEHSHAYFISSYQVSLDSVQSFWRDAETTDFKNSYLFSTMLKIPSKFDFVEFGIIQQITILFWNQWYIGLLLDIKYHNLH